MRFPLRSPTRTVAGHVVMCVTRGGSRRDRIGALNLLHRYEAMVHSGENASPKRTIAMDDVGGPGRADEADIVQPVAETSQHAAVMFIPSEVTESVRLARTARRAL
jgi:hypothetical protein